MSSPVLSRTVTKKSTISLIVIAVLTAFVLVSAVPRYVSGWPWANPLKVHNQSQLQAIREQGIALPGWTVEEQASAKIGGDSWSIQQIAFNSKGAVGPDAGAVSADALPLAASSQTAFLLLRPQVWEADQPEVEWLDLSGFQQWKTDSMTKLPFEVSSGVSSTMLSKVAGENSQSLSVNSETVRIKADFFRAWSKDQTYAILQWYASPMGGSASPAWWFWADQKAQWRYRQRLPWVAVSVWIPIDALSAIAPHRETAVTLGKAIQSELLQTVFAGALSDASPKR